ncbi:Protein of unknown function [Haloechinothrix alba]|uniref:DUF3558 domain-containing protein n=2 Tax=Haloechinothrix alba TaxID=664784 RepID=A0A238WQ47_9PSEU|nr:Protein of unknown function [Haloechinothrix alba]
MLLAGRSQETGGDAEAEAPDSGKQQSADLPHSGAPAVQDPIEDTSAFENDVCSVLTEAQVDRLDVEIQQSEEDGQDFGPACRWRTETRDESFTTALLTVDGEGLSTSYADEQADRVELFEELDLIAGHPVVAVDLNDDREDGYCNVEVGLRDDLSFYLALSADVDSSPYHDDSCGAAYEIAGMAVETIEGGQ